MVVLDDLEGLLQPKQFYDSMIHIVFNIFILAGCYRNRRTGLCTWGFFCPDSLGPQSMEDALSFSQPFLAQSSSKYREDEQ